MKKYAALVAVAILAAFAAPALAATNPFMDVPMNHWAYDAIGQLAASGILSGYPDGTYKGKQPTTRYEMASALARMLAVVDMTKADRNDVEMLKKLVIEFKDELDALGVKVDQIDKRLAVVEDRLGGWKLSGVMRFEFFNLGGIEANDDDLSGTELQRARILMDRWFGEDESLHFHVRFDGRDDAFSKTSGKSTPNWTRFFVEMPVFWDMKMTVGRFLWDFEAPYYLDGTTTHAAQMGTGHDAWLMDRGIDGIGIQKSFGMGNFHAYAGHPNKNFMLTQGKYPDTYDGNKAKEDEAKLLSGLGMWELFAMGQFQFNEQFGFDIGVQAFIGDDSSDFDYNYTLPGISFSEFNFNNLYTIFAGLRFNFNDSIAFKGMYYYQDAGAEIYSPTTNSWYDYVDDSTSAFRAIIDVKQDLLQFTSLWLEYDHLEEGFVMPTGVSALFSNTDLGGKVVKKLTKAGFQDNMLTSDVNIWRIAAGQQWNDKWSTNLQFANYSVDEMNAWGDDADFQQWGVGVNYQYNPNVIFGLHYSKLTFDDEFELDDIDLIRFRTTVTF